MHYGEDHEGNAHIALEAQRKVSNLDLEQGWAQRMQVKAVLKEKLHFSYRMS